MADPTSSLQQPVRGIRSMATFLLGVIVTAIGALALITEVFGQSFSVVGPPIALGAAIVVFTAVTAAPRR